MPNVKTIDFQGPTPLATHIEVTLDRPHGAQVRIVGNLDFGVNLVPRKSMHVLRRNQPTENWVLCSDAKPEGWKQMPRAEYLQHGRSEMFQAVTVPEFMKAGSALGRPLEEAKALLEQMSEKARAAVAAEAQAAPAEDEGTPSDPDATLA